MDMGSAVARFIQAISANLKLEFVELSNVPMPGIEPLLAITNIPTLKNLTVDLNRLLSSDGLLDFVKALRETSIDKLILRHVRELSYAILDALAELPFLLAFCIRASHPSYSVTHVSNEGLQQILRKSSSLTEALFNHPW
ncbi:hypothetical protein BJV82DRAFT_673048 [Fennellomyces sp. T-0311]|nr:hypothetical protein BJV82DRAFT_673048 [Fennellomyces sp. T-0311]